MKKTIDEQIASVQREIQMRQRCYPKWIKDGRLNATTAAHEIECMESVLRTLHEVRVKSLSVNKP